MQTKQSKNTYRICINRGKKGRLFFKTWKDQLNDYQSKVDVKRGKPEPFINMALKGKRNTVNDCFYCTSQLPQHTHWLFHSFFWQFLSSSTAEYCKVFASRNYLAKACTYSVTCLRTCLSSSFSLSYVKFEVLLHLHCMQTPSGFGATWHPFKLPPGVLARSCLKHRNRQCRSENIHLL